MTPEAAVSIVTSLISIVDKAGGWPISTTLIAVTCGPWAIFAVIVWKVLQKADKAAKESKERFESVVKMYEDNVKLVESYEKLSDNMLAIITSNTRAMTALEEAAEHNFFCPIARQGTKPKELHA